MTGRRQRPRRQRKRRTRLRSDGEIMETHCGGAVCAAAMILLYYTENEVFR